MHKTTFHINNTAQDCEIEVDLIVAQGGKLNPTLVIPLSIELHKNHTEKKEKFTLTFLESRLKFQNLDIIASSIIKPLSMDVERFTKQTARLEFSLTKDLISELEISRNSDISFEINLLFHYEVFIKYKIDQNSSQVSTEINIFNNLSNVSCKLDYTLQQSQWINKILPGFGYKTSKLIELPLSSDLLEDCFPASVEELENALSYFKNGDYDKSVSHCRGALEPIKKRLPEIKSIIDSNSEYEWFKKSLLSALISLESITKETFNLSSKTHHTPLLGHFNRKTAESVILMTTSLISFVSQIETQK